MLPISKSEILKWIRGSYTQGDDNPLIQSVTTDSRLVKENSLYVAMKGERVDGHDYIEQAFEQGAVSAISERSSKDHRVILVNNSVTALGDMAREYIKLFDLKKYGVTGSSGKTSTKDMLYYILSQKFKTLRSTGNHNNEIGLPLTVLDLDREIQAGIFEMGMYQLGEIDYLAEIIRPQIALITNVGSCHIEHLGTRENIFHAKMEITNYFDEKSVLIVNGDDIFLRGLKKEDHKYDLIKAGFEEGNDLQGKDYHVEQNRIHFRVQGLGVDEELVLPMIGSHHANNALLCVAAGLVSGLDIEEIKQGLLDFEPSGNRMQMHQIKGYTLIDDSYNANPESMKAVLKSLRDFDGARRIGVLGDMLELGELSLVEHEAIGALAGETLDRVIFVGAEMKAAMESALQHGMALENVHWVEDSSSAIKILQDIISQGDLLLVKGSRGMKLEIVVNALLEQ